MKNENEETSEKKEIAVKKDKTKKKVTFNDIKNGFLNFLESLQSNTKSLIILGITLIVLMGIITLAIFLMTVKGSEEVMVPDVVGKELTSALLDMQVKELYPKIQLRYSNSPEEKGCVLEQNPSAGAIVKAGRRIELVVSRGVILEEVENYVGQSLDEVRIHLQTLFTSSDKALVTLDENIMYDYSQQEAGTILAQEPAPETSITDPIKLKLVVSRGPEHEKAKVPNLVGLTVNDTLLQMSRSKLVFDFTSRPVDSGETAGTIVSQMVDVDTYVDTYSRVQAVFAYPEEKDPEQIYGIFSEELPSYPYALQIKLDALTPDGDKFNVVTMMHPGGRITIPYILPFGTELTLSIYDKEALRVTVQ
ncbi:MAG: PASTA domain-containing protein [Treponemataceae bacterium]|nr:PASTA domain-containing protein [Treponemataceae bacterium]